ncbi:MAG: ABC transporter permease, partial [Proteobacteria bacterium]|nr:ABC transporter permease [Pseudomonadota bacterium]
MNQAWIVFVKELRDALRDRRTLLRLALPAVLMGPLLLSALSGLIASLEERADKREVLVAGMEAAPTLANYIERQTYTMKPAPADYEAQLRASTLLEPVLVVPKDFEARLRVGEAPTVEIVSDSANQRAMAGTGPLRGLLQGFSRERAVLNLALRGVSTELLEPVDVQERDLASAQARAARLTSIIPMFVIMAVATDTRIIRSNAAIAIGATVGKRRR